MQTKEHAKLTDDVYEVVDPEMDDTIFFLLRDSTHEFTIALSDILECLKFAEEKGEVPELPFKWWQKIAELFPSLDHTVNTIEEDE